MVLWHEEQKWKNIVNWVLFWVLLEFELSCLSTVRELFLCFIWAVFEFYIWVQWVYVVNLKSKFKYSLFDTLLYMGG